MSDDAQISSEVLTSPPVGIEERNTKSVRKRPRISISHANNKQSYSNHSPQPLPPPPQTETNIPSTDVRINANHHPPKVKTGSIRSFHDSLKTFQLKKGDPTTHMTNTRIGDKELRISGGSYHIPEEKYVDFLKSYYTNIVEQGYSEYMTEKQLLDDGPILVDIDLRYEYAVTNRLHNKDHIIDLVYLYLEELKNMFQLEESEQSHIFVCVLEKDHVNRLEDKQITKDGIHLMLLMKTDRISQIILRERILEKIGAIWTDLPIINTWSDVFDNAITKGTNQWQLVGSKKPNHEPYRVTYVFDTYMDSSTGEFICQETSISMFSTIENFPRLSARYSQHPHFFLSTYFVDEHTQRKNGNTNISGTRISNNHYQRISNTYISPDVLLSVTTKEELDILVEQFLENLSIDNFHLREAYDYTMILPESYYEHGSFLQWIRVGWALRNIDDSLFIVWVAFSAQATHFQYRSIRDLWERWQTFNQHNTNGLTKRSIMYWARKDNYEGYKKLYNKSVDCYLEMTIDRVFMTHTGDKGRLQSCSDYDIAMVLYQLYRNEFVCVSVKGNIWYQYQNHKWAEIDSGLSLRLYISSKLRDLYYVKLQKLQAMILTEGIEAAQKEKLTKRVEAITSIMNRLGRTADKKNIMTEARDLFYDGDFIDNLDKNPYLLCFNNGVIDFQEKRFRKGLPEDNISLSTKIDYIPISTIEHEQQKAEIIQFMNEIFPDPNLNAYMWDHLASCLIGTCVNQTLSYYYGKGSNGKSQLCNLMENILGDYKCDVPLTVLTGDRQRVGGLSPELVLLKGRRYAIIQEPSKGDKINEGVMKQLTGGDPIQARAPYMPSMLTFVPQFKLVICANNLVEVKANDYGTWRRIRVIMFDSLFTTNPKPTPATPHQFLVNPNIKDKFVTWRTVFAALLVERAFQTNGIVKDCERVLAASNSYRQEQDLISRFVEDKIEHDLSRSITKSEIAEEYRQWYKDNSSNQKGIDMQGLYEYLDSAFGKCFNGIWKGIRIKRYQSGDQSMDHQSVSEISEMVESSSLQTSYSRER